MVIEREKASEDFEVFPENWDTVLMWSRMATQWRTTMDGAIGLDYNVLRWFFELYSVEEPKQMLEDLQVMEAAYLDCKARQ